MKKSIIRWRPYQMPVFADIKTGIVVLHWSRQIGKSFTLAVWTVNRLLTRPGRLVTVLSNSRDNGAEFLLKCAEVLQGLGRALKRIHEPPDVPFQSMRMEARVVVEGKTSRIKVLAANPRTARGFSGDLILDEFAFHEDSQAIWEAAEPILASNPDFLCRIASTGNGKHNMFYRMATSGKFKLSRVTRTDAWNQGVKVYDPNTREEISPDKARAQALDKRAYDQNYECAFADENMTLLTHELIDAAERDDVGWIGSQHWSAGVLATLKECKGPLYVGLDVGRFRDLTVISVVERLEGIHYVRAILRIENMRLPDQQKRLAEICKLPRFRRAAIDMTGLGLGLYEYAQDEFGVSRIQGINFAASVPTTKLIELEGRRQTTVRVTEAMATELLQVYENHRIQHPADEQLRDDLRKPEKITSPGGRVSIAATRDEAGHADHFWSLALAIDAAAGSNGPFAYKAVDLPGRNFAGNLRRHGRTKGVLL